MSRILSIQQLTKQYSDQTVVDAVNLDVREGETLVLVGASGSGKTTLLKMINRLVEPSRGRVLFHGEDTRSLVAEDLRRSIGYVIQGAGLIPHLSVALNVSLVPRLLGWKEDRIRQRVSTLLEMVGLPAEVFAERRPGTLSGGQRQRVGIARALAADPPLVLLDEPFGALDPVTRQQITEEFRNLETLIRKTMILVTHDIHEAIQLGDRIAVLDRGRVLQVGSAAQLTFHPDHPKVHELFGRRAERLLWQVTPIRSLLPWLHGLRSREEAGGPEVHMLSDGSRMIEVLDHAGDAEGGRFSLKGSRGSFDLNDLLQAWRTYRSAGVQPKSEGPQ